MIFFLAALGSLDGSAIGPQAQGAWAPAGAACGSAVDRLTISADKLQWYDAAGYLLLGKPFVGKDAEDGSILVRVEGENADSAAMFWRSTLRIRVLSPTALRIDRIDDSGSQLATIDYHRC